MRWTAGAAGDDPLAFVDLDGASASRSPAPHHQVSWPMRPWPGCRPSSTWMYADVGRPLDSSRAPVEGVAADCVVLGEERARLLRGVGLQPAVPLVLGHATDGAQLRRHGVHEEPAAAAGAPSRPASCSTRLVLAADRSKPAFGIEHFTVDGTLIEAAASLKSFKPRGADPPPDDGDRGNPLVDFHGDRRANATHQSATDREARLFRKGKGKEARLVFDGPMPADGEPQAGPASVDFLAPPSPSTGISGAGPRSRVLAGL